MALESLAALSVASSIAQFVDFGCRLFFETKSLYNSSNSLANEAVELENISQTLGCLSKGLVAEASSGADSDKIFPLEAANGTVPSSDEGDLTLIAQECLKVAQELSAALDQLKVKGSGRKWQCFRVTLKSIWKPERVEKIARRMERFSSQLTMCLVKILNKKQSEALSFIHTLSRANEQFVSATNSNFESARCNTLVILRKLEDADKMQTRNEQEREDREQRLSLQLSHLSSNLRRLTETGERSTRESRILESLCYDRMEARQEKIIDANAQTFEWIFDPDTPSSESAPRNDFLQWLTKGSGIFWITGKAGSGKSTLMKFLTHHTATTEALEQWANDKALVMADFFFWHAGTELQKSQEGLLQSLLYGILSQCPDSMPQIVPKRWEQSKSNHAVSQPWSRTELLAAFAKLSVQTTMEKRFCFFVDGLDEYDGDHAEIVDLVKGFVQSKDIKICLSSRPWNVFTRAFGFGSHPTIRLEDLTWQDIQSILCVAKIFKTKLSAEPLNLMTYVMVDEIEENLDYAMELPVQPISKGEIESRCQEMKLRINARCRDLLQVSRKVSRKTTHNSMLESGLDYSLCSEEPLEGEPSLQPLFPYEVDFLHRTVRDFFRVNDIQTFVASRLTRNFDWSDRLCHAFLARIKVASFEPKPLDRVAEVSNLIDDLMHYAHEAEKQTAHPNTVLLDELATTAKHHYDHLQLQASVSFVLFERLEESISTFGSRELSIVRICQSILGFAVQRDLQVYVRYKLDKRLHQGLPALENEGLVLDAVQPPVSSKYNLQNPNREMLRLLVEKGVAVNKPCANSDGTLAGSNIWHRIVEQAGRKWDYSCSIRHLERIHALLEIGADHHRKFEGNALWLHLVGSIFHVQFSAGFSVETKGSILVTIKKFLGLGAQLNDVYVRGSYRSTVTEVLARVFTATEMEELQLLQRHAKVEDVDAKTSRLQRRREKKKRKERKKKARSKVAMVRTVHPDASGRPK